MRAGSRNCLITIQKKTPDKDDWGQPLPEGWEKVADIRANVKNLSGSESIKADAVTSTVRTSIRVAWHWRTVINAGMRAQASGMTYNIRAVLPDCERKQHVDLVCEAVA